MAEEIGRGGMTSKLVEIVGSESEFLPLLLLNFESRIWFVVSSDTKFVISLLDGAAHMSSHPLHLE